MNTTRQRTPTGHGKSAAEPTPEEIALYAYAIWEHEGRPEGREIEHWQQAEAQLRAARPLADRARPVLVGGGESHKLP